METKEFAKQIERGAQLGALAVLKNQNPLSDEISRSEAYRIAGKRWIDKQINEGNLVGQRRGKAANCKVFFSRLEIAALREAQIAEKRLKTNKS